MTLRERECLGVYCQGGWSGCGLPIGHVGKHKEQSFAFHIIVLVIFVAIIGTLGGYSLGVYLRSVFPIERSPLKVSKLTPTFDSVAVGPGALVLESKTMCICPGYLEYASPSDWSRVCGYIVSWFKKHPGGVISGPKCMCNYQRKAFDKAKIKRICRIKS